MITPERMAQLARQAAKMVEAASVEPGSWRLDSSRAWTSPVTAAVFQQLVAMELVQDIDAASTTDPRFDTGDRTMDAALAEDDRKLEAFAAYKGKDGRVSFTVTKVWRVRLEDLYGGNAPPEGPSVNRKHLYTKDIIHANAAGAAERAILEYDGPRMLDGYEVRPVVTSVELVTVVTEY